MQTLKKSLTIIHVFYLLIHSFIKFYIYRLAFVLGDTSDAREKTCQALERKVVSVLLRAGKQKLDMS